MTEFQVKVNGNTESELRDCEAVQNADPFGDKAILYIDDSDGERASAYTRNTPVTVEAREFGSGNSFQTLLDGFVVEPRPRDDSPGGGILEVLCYSNDYLLKNGTVNTDLSGQSISSAIKEIIQDWTPLTYNSSLVDVVNDTQVTRSFANERVDNIFLALRSKSGNETLGVNSNLEFFFRPAETKTVSRGIGPEHVTGTDLPTKAQEQLNEARVFFDDGNRAVITDDSSAKKSLQDKLGASEAVAFDESVMREQIQTRGDAIDAGDQILTDRQPTLSGTVETFGLLDADPGDTLPVNLPHRGIRDEVVIAQVNYMMPDTTEVTIVQTPADQQKSEDPHSDMLVRMSDTLKRVEMRPAAAKEQLEEIVRTLETQVGIVIESGGAVDGVPLEDVLVTNQGFAAIRDAFIAETPLDISSVLLGTSDAPVSRTQTSLDSQAESVSASVSTAAAEVSVSGSPTTGSDVQEVGLETASGDLLLRGVTAEPVSAPSSAEVSLVISDDADIEDSVVTDDGKTLVRDVLANNSPSWPASFALGDDSSALDETASSLGNQVANNTLGNFFLEEVATDADWRNILPTDRDDNLESEYVYLDGSGSLYHAQTAFVRDAQDLVSSNITTGSEFTGSEAANIQSNGTSSLFFQFTPDTDLTNVAVAVRARDNDGSSEMEFEVNGARRKLSITSNLEWQRLDMPTTLTAGEATNFFVSGLFANDVDVDVVAVYDPTVYPSVSNFDNDTGGNGEYLADPTLYPASTDIALGEGGSISLDQETGQLTVTSGWNNTDTNQALIVEGNTANNTQSTTQTFAFTSELDVTLRLSHFGSRTTATPTTGFNGQRVDNVDLESIESGIAPSGTASLSLQSSFSAGTLTGTTLTEGGIKNNANNLTTESVLADVFIESGVTLYASETWRLKNAQLPVNESNFDPAITDLRGVDSGDITGQANFQVKITGGETDG